MSSTIDLHKQPRGRSFSLDQIPAFGDEPITFHLALPPLWSNRSRVDLETRFGCEVRRATSRPAERRMTRRQTLPPLRRALTAPRDRRRCPRGEGSRARGSCEEFPRPVRREPDPEACGASVVYATHRPSDMDGALVFVSTSQLTQPGRPPRRTDGRSRDEANYTTIMLRNIPNKYSRQMLIDQSGPSVTEGSQKVRFSREEQQVAR